jgi:stress response protein YsnF
LKVLHR